jgi:hypothetical protein
MKVAIAVVIAATMTAATAAGSTPELRKSRKAAAMMNGVVYRASLFAPQALVKTTAAGWEGSDYTAKDYHWLQLVYRGNDAARGGGMNIVSAPGVKQTVAATIQLLHTVRASSPDVGIRAGPIVNVTLHGFPAKQFDGTVSGPHGHTFVPFSGRSSGSSEAAGDHFKLLADDLFRIIVCSIDGTPIVFFLDSGGAPSLNAEFLRESTRIVNAMRFTT